MNRVIFKGRKVVPHFKINMNSHNANDRYNTNENIEEMYYQFYD
jgi:hypothetical protein